MTSLNLELVNGLFRLQNLCMTMLIWKSESQTAVATQLRFSRSTSRTFAEFISLHYCYGSPISWVQKWLSMGAIVCQWPCLYSWITWWAESKIKELEGWTGREGTLGKRWKDQDKSCACTQRLESEDCFCQIPMWYIYERLWSQFNPLSCRNCVHKFKKLWRFHL